MREIVLDTETTGLNPLGGDRLVEIGCIELENHLATGKSWHRYLNPQRDVPDEAARVHGLTSEFLADKPLFAQEVDGFLAFIGNDPLIIHNASFDMGFLNAELVRTGFPQLLMARAIDTLALARKKYPGAPASLDALCKRFAIDASARSFHGALLDAQLLAEVYLELCGGRQPGLEMGLSEQAAALRDAAPRAFRAARVFAPSPEELAAHEEFIARMKNPIWNGKEDAR
jgi:DNA polymerase-3 subunit epsilon